MASSSSLIMRSEFTLNFSDDDREWTPVHLSGQNNGPPEEFKVGLFVFPFKCNVMLMLLANTRNCKCNVMLLANTRN